jgi:hypothetical protein
VIILPIITSLMFLGLGIDTIVNKRNHSNWYTAILMFLIAFDDVVDIIQFIFK